MTKTNDGTPPADQEPEVTTGAQDISWQSAMDSTTDEAPGNGQAPADPASAIPEAVTGKADAVVETTAGDGDTDDSDSVDFVLADPPGEKTGEEPAFGSKAKEANALWASLATGAPAGRPEAEGEGGKQSPFETAEEDTGIPPLIAAPGKKEKAAKKRPPASGPFGGKSFGPIVPSRPMMRDEEGNIVPTPATLTSRLFTALALIPIILPVVLFLAQVVLTLDTRALWYSDEVRYADAYRSMVDSGNWLVMHLNGAIYPDKPPMFFWFLYGLEEAAKAAAHMLPIQITETALLFAGVAISGLLCLLATHALASIVGRVDRRTVLAADLILISGFFFTGLAHYLRMDLLFTACITASHIFLFHAWVRDKAPLLMTLGYLLAGAAVLVKGPLGLAFPVLAGICFLVWQGRFLRFFKLDAVFGLVIGLAVPGVWLALAWMNTGDVFLNNVLHKQVLARALDTWHHSEPWYHYLMTFPLIWLPWTLVLLFLPWGRFMGKDMREGLKVSRTTDGAGIAYLWCAFLPGLILLSLVSIKLPIYCLPLFPPLAVLCARAVLRMRPFAAACLQYSVALLLALLGLALLLLPAAPGKYLPIPVLPNGVMLLGGICLVFACALAFLIKPRRGEGAVLFLALFAAVFAYPTWKITAPSLDVFLSPKAQAEVIKSYRAEGYAPASFKIYPGTYSYYAGAVLDCPTWEEALAFADKNPKTILALRSSFWDSMPDKPEGFALVNRQTIAEREYVLVARPPLDGEEPAKAEPEAEMPAPETMPDTAPEAATPPAPAEPESQSDPGSNAGQQGAAPSKLAPGEDASDTPAPDAAPAA